MNYKISDIHDAALSWLKLSTLKNVCSTIESYNGEAQALIDDVKSMLIDFPAALVLYGGSSFDAQGSNPYIDNFGLTVVVVAKDLRGGEDVKASMYAMLEEVKKMRDQTLGLEIAPLVLARIRLLAATNIYIIYAVDFSTVFES